MISGIPAILKIVMDIRLIIKNKNLISLPFHLKCLNFNANKGSSAINIKLKIIEIAPRIKGFNKKSNR